VLSTYPLLGDGLLPMALATGPSPQSTRRHCSVNGGSPGMGLRSLGGLHRRACGASTASTQRYRPPSLNAVAVRREHGRVTVCVGGGSSAVRPQKTKRRGRVGPLPPSHPPSPPSPGVSRASGENPPGGVGVSACGTHRRTRFWWAPPGRHTTCVCQPGGVCPGLADIASIAAPHSRCLLDPLRSVPLAHDHSRLDR
jgi:hypothetical protein